MTGEFILYILSLRRLSCKRNKAEGRSSGLRPAFSCPFLSFPALSCPFLTVYYLTFALEIEWHFVTKTCGKVSCLVTKKGRNYEEPTPAAIQECV